MSSLSDIGPKRVKAHREKKQSQKGVQACLQNESLSDSLFDSLEEGIRYLTPLKGSYVTPLREPRFCLQNDSLL